MRPFLSYYGAAWLRAPRYPRPRHKTIIEPFAGSAGYSTRYAAHDVILCDLDEHITGIWGYLIATSGSEILSLPDVPPGATVDDVVWPCEEAKWLAGFWLNTATSHPCKTPSKWMTAGISNGKSWVFWSHHLRLRLAHQVEQIRHWKVHHGRHEDLPCDILSKEATWFIDPPYKEKGHRYRKGSEGIDYPKLGQWCKQRQGQVIVCEQAGADWLPFSPLGSFKSTKGYSKEVVWLNDCAPWVCEQIEMAI